MDLIWAVALVLGVSFVSNVSPFFGASYTIFTTIMLISIRFSPANFLILVVVSALGATVAKVVIYYGAFGLKRVIGKNKNIQLIGRNASRGEFYFVLFVAALLPVLPLDDFIYIGAGASSASVGLMAGVTFLAKIVKSGFEVAIEYTILRDIGLTFGVNRLDETAALALIFVVIGVAIYKLDWEKLYWRLTGRRLSKVPNPS